MINQSACKHLILKPDLELVMVLHFEFYLREAITACRQCGTFYLIKARDLSEKSVLYDVSKLPLENTKKNIKSVNRGSCSINRANDELSFLKSRGSDCGYLVISQNGEFTLTIPKQDLRTHPEAENWTDQPFRES
mgnify:CR=1 FL=1